MGQLLQPEEALEIVLAEVQVAPAESVSLEDALGRVTAESVISGLAVPPFESSAMDGFAVGGGDEKGWLEVVDESRAGHPAERGPGRGQAVRISTGAVVPPGTHSVVPVEQAEEKDGRVMLQTAPPAGANIRGAGEDIGSGDLLLKRGTRIGAAELGVLASVGLTTVECSRRPNLALLATGDELVPPGQPLGPGQIHDTSSYSVRALATEAGAVVGNVERLRDDPDATREGLAHALGNDVVVVCGGVSVGPHDHVKGALAALGVEERFWRVALRPGKPSWFGVRDPDEGRTLVFGLPGNPVSAMVTFHVFVTPALRKMQGLPPDPLRSMAVMDEGLKSAVGRVEYVRCSVERGPDGLHVRPSRKEQGSHVLTSMLGADAVAVVPADRDRLNPGDEVLIESIRPRMPLWALSDTSYGVQ